MLGRALLLSRSAVAGQPAALRRALLVPVAAGVREYKQAANLIRVGDVVDFEGKMCTIVGTSRIERGRGKSYVQLEFRNLKTGTKGSERFRVADTIERLQLTTHELQFLYQQGSTLVFMNPAYEQIELDEEIMGAAYLVKFLQEGMKVSAQLMEDKPISISMPDTVTTTVAEADAKNTQQTSPTFKDAILDNGVKVQVPAYIERGDRVTIRLEDLSYVSREK